MRIRWGLSVPNRGVVIGAADPKDLVAMCELADRSELFDAVFTGDNLISKPRLDAIVFLSLVAGRTRRVTLGTACMASFIFRHPIVLANQWAALDLLSEGRTLLVACLGGGPSTKTGHRSPSGARWEVEFAAMGTTTAERVGRMVEGIQILRALWTGEAVSHHGRFYRFDDVRLNVTPVQRPCPIAIASNPQAPYADEATIERALKRVGEVGDGWQVEMSTPDEFGARWQRILAHAAAAGRHPLPATSMIHFYVNVQDRSQAAFDEARRFYEAYHLGSFPEEYLRWRLVTGTPTEVTERIARFLDAGCTLPILRFASWDPMGQMRRAMETVLPALREHVPATRP
ncbi:MAG TPA: LLM class flavin-dependent oxidoreductase [Methylomirabilota bacterium]|jgi:alkanesulfonate monooxygenase SsuD/methylene tetrahydromethanopterin reductase-like flavin-dependent oxidoreductase (luciferase family)|nr:LLM class flavin-dependent oxidoreductase [Methylomirabilota bacterium]